MIDYFSYEQLDHIYMIFTKCNTIKDKTSLLNKLKSLNEKGKQASKIIYKYLQIIDEKCILTDTQKWDKRMNENVRNNILCEMNKLYNDKGIIKQSIFEIFNKKNVSKINKRNRHLVISAATCIGLGFAGAKLLQNHNQLKTNFSGLNEAQIQLQNQCVTSQQRITELQAKHKRFGTFIWYIIDLYLWQSQWADALSTTK